MLSLREGRGRAEFLEALKTKFDGPQMQWFRDNAGPDEIFEVLERCLLEAGQTCYAKERELRP
eukprot:1871347-Pyramimonas_sp.AAC.1